MAEKLTPKHLKFVYEFVKDFNGTQAAIRAGYAPKAAQEQASRLLSNAMVQQKVFELLQVAAEEAKISAERVIQEFSALAFSDITEVLEVGPDNRITLKRLEDLPKSVTCAIESIAVVKGELRVKMHGKQAALESLARWLSLYPKQMAVLEAMGVLVKEGVVTQDQARIIHDGIASIEARLRPVPDRTAG